MAHVRAVPSCEATHFGVVSKGSHPFRVPQTMDHS